LDEERARFLAAAKIEQAELADWLAHLGRNQEWLDETLATEAVYQRRVAQILTEQALQKELGPMQLNLTRFQLETVKSIHAMLRRKWLPVCATTAWK
jgi:hypothetical protein